MATRRRQLRSSVWHSLFFCIFATATADAALRHNRHAQFGGYRVLLVSSQEDARHHNKNFRRHERTTAPSWVSGLRRIQLLRNLRGGGNEEDKSAPQASIHHPELLKENVMYNGWRKLINRQVRLPGSGATVNFEIVSQGDRGGTVSDEAVLVFVWKRSSRTAVLIREYMPSRHQFLHGLAAGMVEQKHNNNENDMERNSGDYFNGAAMVAARHELEEECRLHGGEWIQLCAPTVVDKYMTTRMTAFLVIDPQEIAEQDAKPRDWTEEGIQIVEGITIQQLEQHLVQGEFTVVASWAIQLALAKLRQLGEI